MMAISQVACGNSIEESVNSGEILEESKEQHEQKEDDVKLEEEALKEEFKQQYALILENIDKLNKNSDFVGAVHSTIWNNVGVKEVAKYINYVKLYYNDDSMSSLVCEAFGVSMFNGSDKRKAYEYAQQYMESLENIETIMEELGEMYQTLKSTYGDKYNVDDIKEYYIESSTYANYASTIDGNYITYNQTLNEYQINIEKLKMAAEIAY